MGADSAPPGNGNPPTESSGEPDQEKSVTHPAPGRETRQQNRVKASADSDRSPAPSAGASSSSLPLDDEELGELNDTLDEILEHDDLLDEIGVRKRLTAHRSRLEAEQQGWLEP